MITEEAIKRIAVLGAEAEGKRLHTLPDGSVILISPDGTHTEVQSPTKDAHGILTDAPSRIKRNVILQTADSLVDYTSRFKTDGATLFADIANDRITAVLDYHLDADNADHAEHHAVLSLPKSEEWKLWSGICGQWMGQLEFARFLRENAADIKTPDAATLLETVQDLQAVRNVNFTKAVRLNSENESFEYTDDTKATGTKGNLIIPELFLLQIPVYFDGRTVEVGAFLRWKLEGNQLLLGIQLRRAEHIRQAVFREIALDVSDRANAPVVYACL
ncbi:MAG: DUF2303 family protein [Asticcacaulis sp.]